MSYYNFAAKMIRPEKSVLDVGCAEGFGTWLLARECGYAKGIDLDGSAIASAQKNWDESSIHFECCDFLTTPPGEYDALVSFDVIEHIYPDNAGTFLENVTGNLKKQGVAIIGTPNIESQKFASEISKRGHVNCYGGERLEKTMQQHFKQVFMFGANDEVVHTGFLPMAHYLIAVGCGVK